MKTLRATIEGSEYIGVFAKATDKFMLAGMGHMAREKEMAETLGIKVIRTAINGSNLIGIYTAANSHHILIPDLIYGRELDAIKKELDDVEVSTMRANLNAFGNNILANDKVAIVNPKYDPEGIKGIEDALDVEVIKASTGGFDTVGANNILTNKGIVINNRCSDDEAAGMESATHFKPERSTANLGSVNIGICAIANSTGCIFGEASTGFEIARISDALML
jgi:translation initiation factor 6